MSPRLTTDSINQLRQPLPLSAWAKGLTIFPSRAFGAIWEENSDSLGVEIVTPQFPLSSIGYLLESDTPLAQIIHGFKLGRLSGIRQLGFLTQPVSLREENLFMLEHFPHNRFTHSLDAATLMALMLENNHHRFTEVECLHGFIATLLHDHGTPAGGDTTKLLNPEDFDEDLHFALAFECPEAQEALTQHGLEPQLLTAIVQERNLLGKIKDIADKLAYICRDAHTFLHGTYVTTKTGEVSYQGVEQILASKQLIGDLWQDVMIVDDKIVFANPVRLIMALLLRVVLTSDLYYNPLSRSYGFVISQAIMRQMYNVGALSRKELLRMVDADLAHEMESWTGVTTWEMKSQLSTGTSFKTFTSHKQAKTFAKKMLRVTPFVLLENFSQSLKTTGTNWLVQTTCGNLQLREVFPKESKLIEDIAQSARRIIVYWINNPHTRLLDGLKRRSG